MENGMSENPKIRWVSWRRKLLTPSQKRVAKAIGEREKAKVTTHLPYHNRNAVQINKSFIDHGLETVKWIFAGHLRQLWITDLCWWTRYFMRIETAVITRNKYGDPLVVRFPVPDSADRFD
jgi:hypothetical protein